ncbi:hypothetical protein V5O48_005553 [Marasmius crinis-equi]|uniref:Protein kinase domain-containing protein n=1 Tax=Marasmius crinis-equi TaxID=585013 RepID=A0ABR3FMV1_9AGAR
MSLLPPTAQTSSLQSSPRISIPSSTRRAAGEPAESTSAGVSPTNQTLQNSFTSDHDHGYLSSSVSSLFRRQGRDVGHAVNVSSPTSRASSVDRRSDTPSWIDKYSPRPWKMTPRKKEPVPKEQTEAYLRTEARVKLAVDVIKHTARGALEVAEEVGELLPGLGIAAKLLSNIWDAVEGVDSNRLACLRLTERCAEILLAVNEELDEAEEVVGHEMQLPLERLEESFSQFHGFLVEQNTQPFWARYLKRDEILEKIDNCDKALNDALFLFNMRIQLRLMANIKGLARPHESVAPRGLELEVTDNEEPSPLDEVDSEFGDFKNLDSDVDPPSPSLQSVPLDDLAIEEASNIRNFLRTLQEHQNRLDRARDSSDIRQLLSSALKSDTNQEMIRILQMGKHDMLHAIRYFLEAWDTRPLHSHVPGSSRLPPLKDLPRIRSMTWPLDEKQGNLLDKEYLDPDILRGPLNVGLPSWTINKSQVTCQELIGHGFFSRVYKGTWRHRTVAIKILESSTPRDLFISEFEVWKTLNHPNVLRLLGMSDPAGPGKLWFFVSPFMRNGTLPQYLKRLEWEFAGLGFHENTNRSMALELARFVLEIARGMEYLHDCRVVHGDLKGANILMDNDSRCVLADFGHSKFTSQITHSDPKPNHGFRWQSPELMAGRSLLSRENDIYAYAITSVEVLTMGSLPWPMLPDDLVKIRVLDKKERPPYPVSLTNSLGIGDIIERCWDTAPMERPSFSKVVRELELATQRRARGTSA